MGLEPLGAGAHDARVHVAHVPGHDRVERGAGERVSIAGPYCESGDVLIEDLSMPKIEVGELLGIGVLDHVIIATRGIVSFRSRQLL